MTAGPGDAAWALEALGWWLLPLALLVALLLAGRGLAGLAAHVAVRLSGERPPPRARTGREGMVGLRGVARSDLAPRGKVFVRGELWDAVADDPVPASQPVEVVDLDGLTLVVRPLRDTEEE